jgi:DNA-binding transcriptional LysR family regulator
MMDLPETSEIEAFVRLVETGSLTSAARELGVPRATLSRRLARLEERLGVRLAFRTTRKVGLTDAGTAFYPSARDVLRSVDDATRAVMADEGPPRGPLRLSVPPITDPQFRGMLVDFVERYPLVDVEVIASTRHEDLVARGIDVALRAGSSLDPGLIARRLRSVAVFAVAAPAYLERAGPLTSAELLVEHVCLVGFGANDHPVTHWPLVSGGSVRVRGRIVCNDLLVLRDAATRGLGIALLAEVFCARDLASGALVRVLPDEIGTTSALSLVYPDRRLLKPATRAFVAHALAWMDRPITEWNPDGDHDAPPMR